ncbi:MAG: HEAT repeat domain-containing protein [Caldisericia bacterium]|nr:HEAT repeat domain-containing protein [Caldisericia bacterium]
MNYNIIEILKKNRDYDGLISLLKDDTFENRVEIVQVLSTVKDKHVFQELMLTLRLDLDEKVRSACAEAIGSTKNVSALTPLIVALKDESGSVRARAAEGLGRLKDARAAHSLLNLLNDSNPGVRRIAVSSLGVIAAPKSLDSIIGCLNDPDKYVRAAAAGAIGRFNSKKGIGPLKLLLSDVSDKIVRSAIEGIARIEDQQALAVLEEFKDSEKCPSRIEMVLNQSIQRLEKKLFAIEMKKTVEDIKESDAGKAYKNFKDILKELKDEEI